MHNDTRTPEEKEKHEAAFDAYVDENPEHVCHVIGCGKQWIPDTGTLIVFGGGKRSECSVGTVFYICADHDSDQHVTTVQRDGFALTINPT